jgi:hypothetical protein
VRSEALERHGDELGVKWEHNRRGRTEELRKCLAAGVADAPPTAQVGRVSCLSAD